MAQRDALPPPRPEVANRSGDKSSTEGIEPGSPVPVCFQISTLFWTAFFFFFHLFLLVGG